MNANSGFQGKKMKFSIKDFLSKCDQICSFLQIWSNLLQQSLVVDFIFCAVFHARNNLQTILKVIKLGSYMGQ